MDNTFLSYYETELTHLREMATEFADLHPTVARNLSLETVPCPDPYVERLLEGVAYLGARTRLKLDYESSRHVRTLLDALYPDLAAPAPAMTMTELQPGPQVVSMLSGHRVERGTRLVASLRDGISTRAVYTTAQSVDLWPIKIAGAEYLQDRAALKSAGASDGAIGSAEAGIRLVIERNGGEPINELTLDRLDLYLGGTSNGAQLFDGIFGWSRNVIARPLDDEQSYRSLGTPEMVGVADDEGLSPRVRPSFEGYRLLREYFLMPERFHYVRFEGLREVVKKAQGAAIELIVLLERPQSDLTGVKAEDFLPFVTPIVNLFERECNIVELDRRRPSTIVHADRTRPRDFEIYRLLRVEDADRDGPAAKLENLYSMGPGRETNSFFATDRRPRRPSDDEVAAGQMRTSYSGDDFIIAVTQPSATPKASSVRRLDVRALCTNRDLPILDDTPKLTLEAGDPVGAVRLLQAMRRPRASLSAQLPNDGRGTADKEDLTWRWISQLSLSQVTLSEEGAAPLHALVSLYADRGDPAFARHGRSITSVSAEPVMERLAMAGPICFAHGTDITLDIDVGVLSGSSRLLLSALLARLFARNAAINSFVRTTSRLTVAQEEIVWPSAVGTRSLM